LQDIRKTWDVKDLLNWSQEYFVSKGINQPKLSSELLLADVLNFTRMQIYLNFDHRPTEKELARFKEYILKRVGHMPIQYILKKAFFRNLELYVDENVLIPRPETELLVDRVLNIISDIVREKAAVFGDLSGKDIPEISINILEIGTGSGAIALSLIKESKQFIAKALVSAQKNGLNKLLSRGNEQAGSHLIEGNSSSSVSAFVSDSSGSFNALQATKISSGVKLKLTATEKSQAALKVAVKNANSLLTEEERQNADFIEADIIPPENSSFICEFKEKINIIVSNPPYISEKNYAGLPEEVRDFEPQCALIAGKTGLEIYKKILDETLGLFRAGNSFFVFEIDPHVRQSLQKFVSETISPGNIEIYKDYNQLERIMVIKI
jgi:release factor-specific protein-(glutamine-N5) methyltransferase